MQSLQIHPAVGIARLGNSHDEFYLAPDAIGGRPYRCDPYGNPVLSGDRPTPVERYKDANGRILRQGALFRVYATGPDGSVQEVTLSTPGVKAITWTVHLANKKAAWYLFSELEGNQMFGQENSYEARGVPLHNATVTGVEARRKLIIDPGPRSVSGARAQAEFDRGTIPENYPYGSFPAQRPTQGTPIETLGELRTDDRGRLVVLGGYGHAGGDESIESFGGGDTWHDDISDGPVYCTVTYDDGSTQDLTAWCVVGSPKFAPELVNPVTLDDVAFDVAVRYHGLAPEMFSDGEFNQSYVVNFDRDVAPLIRRPLDSLWVANVPTMAVFSAPFFDVRDPSDANRAAREGYARYFRRPGTLQDGQHNQLWTGTPPNGDPDRGAPMMPLQSGSNSVWNILIDKFLTLTETQYFFLQQWADGKFSVEPGGGFGLNPLDRAALGNCVGGPMCPGIEVTWSTRNPAIWDPDRPYRILHAHDEAWYREHGLDPLREEATAPGHPDATPGCEPGDLTKRMAIPWQADFFQCTAQLINYSDPNVNKDANHIPVPPTFYGYWWPPQSPMFVLSGYTSVEEQAAAGVPAGFQVYYPRGINTFAQMITGWWYLGFIVNQNEAEDRELYPYFAERERNHEAFAVASVAVGDVSNFVNPTDITFWPVWYMKEDEATRPSLLRGVAPAMLRDDRATRPVRLPTRGIQGRRHHPEPPGVAEAETPDPAPAGS